MLFHLTLSLRIFFLLFKEIFIKKYFTWQRLCKLFCVIMSQIYKNVICVCVCVCKPTHFNLYIHIFGKNNSLVGGSLSSIQVQKLFEDLFHIFLGIWILQGQSIKRNSGYTVATFMSDYMPSLYKEMKVLASDYNKAKK